MGIKAQLFTFLRTQIVLLFIIVNRQQVNDVRLIHMQINSSAPTPFALPALVVRPPHFTYATGPFNRITRICKGQSKMLPVGSVKCYQSNGAFPVFYAQVF